MAEGAGRVGAAAPSGAERESLAPDTQTVEERPETPDTVSLAVTGDVLLHSRLVEAAEEPDGGYDFLPLLEEQQPYIGQADVALCNLETPIGEPPYRGYPRFDVPAQIVSDVAAVGYDGCTTATNHTMDDGVDGVHGTLDTLEEAGLFATGSYRDEVESASPPIVDVQGIELGVVAATFSLNGLTADTDWRVDTDISGPTLIERGEAVRDAGAEIVVAAVHDGAEYATRPTASQRQLGHDLAESGAFDFIYMHHTHSVLPIEKHDGTWIVFGAGQLGGPACDPDRAQSRGDQRPSHLRRAGRRHLGRHGIGMGAALPH